MSNQIYSNLHYYFFGIPRLRNMFLTFKTPKPDRSLLLLRAGPSSNIRPGMPSSHPSDISLASGPGDKMRQGAVEAPHTTGISMNGSRGLFSLLAVPTFIPSILFYILYLSILSKSPNPVLEPTIAREYPGSPSALLQVLDQCRVAFPKSSAIFSHHPVPFLGEMNTRQSTIKQLLHFSNRNFRPESMFRMVWWHVSIGRLLGAAWCSWLGTHFVSSWLPRSRESQASSSPWSPRKRNFFSTFWAHGEFGYILRMIKSNMQ